MGMLLLDPPPDPELPFEPSLLLPEPLFELPLPELLLLEPLEPLSLLLPLDPLPELPLLDPEPFDVLKLPPWLSRVPP